MTLDVREAEKRAREARARAEKASPGPWVQDGELGCDNVRAPNMRLTVGDPLDGDPDGDPGICYTEGYDFGVDDDGNHLPCQDAAFIAGARTDVPALCDDVEALADLARVRVPREEAMSDEKPSGIDVLTTAMREKDEEIKRLREAIVEWGRAYSPPDCPACAVLDAALRGEK